MSCLGPGCRRKAKKKYCSTKCGTAFRKVLVRLREESHAQDIRAAMLDQLGYGDYGGQSKFVVAKTAAEILGVTVRTVLEELPVAKTFEDSKRTVLLIDPMAIMEAIDSTVIRAGRGRRRLPEDWETFQIYVAMKILDGGRKS